MVVGVKEVGMVGQPTQPENDQHDNEHLGKLKFDIKYMKIWWPLFKVKDCNSRK